jgi:hypothetical protein
MSIRKIDLDTYAIHPRGRFGPAYRVGRRTAWLYRGMVFLLWVVGLAGFFVLQRLLKASPFERFSDVGALAAIFLLILLSRRGLERWLRQREAVVDWGLPSPLPAPWLYWLAGLPLFALIAYFVFAGFHTGGAPLGAIVLALAAGGAAIAYGFYRLLAAVMGTRR